MKLGPDWIGETRRHAAAGNLRVWDDLFHLALNEFTAVDHLTSFAAVSHLFNTDARKFCLLCLAVRRGEKAEEAAPRIYGQSFSSLQSSCVRAVLGR